MLPNASQLHGLQDRLSDDLIAFVPELILCFTIVIALLLRLIRGFDSFHRVSLAIVSVAVAAGFLGAQWPAAGGEVFTGLLRLDAWAAWFRIFILLATLLVLLLAWLSGLPDAEDSGDFVVLLLGAALGLMLMTSANHLLILFLAIEMASLPSYALAGFLKGRVTGSEAALKYVVYGAAAGGVMLYGISLITARVGTGYLPVVSRTLAESGFELPFAAGLFFLAVGLGYKLSVVPFHVWLPDVFEGAAAEIGAFLSVASKAAALALTGRVLMQILGDMKTASSFLNDVGLPLAVLAAVTATFGNLMAYAQTNLKRLLGYSTIAHAGFLLAGLATGQKDGFTATLVYLGAYLLANLGAFATVAAIRNRTGQEEVSSLTGLMKSSPGLCVGFALCVMSLLGLPPLAGFAGKFLVFESLLTMPSLAWWIVGGVLLVNTALGAGYYLKLLRIAVLDDAPDAVMKPAPGGLTMLVLALGLASLVLGVLWSPLLATATEAVADLK